ncbi:MAG: hypothetical protein ACREDK_00885 [Thermoplasmata archaeon]
MPTKGESAAASEPARNRCRCGHYPTSHMRVGPLTDAGGFRLEVAAPCAVCGEAACARFTPAL